MPQSAGLSRNADKNISMDQLKGRLRAWGVIKNLRDGDVLSIKNDIDSTVTTRGRLVFADDILLDNLEIERHFQRKRGYLKESAHQKRKRNIKILPLPFKFITIEDLDNFKYFRRLWFYARVHFEFSFETGKWAPDSRGLYARNENLKADLSALSNMHNMVFEALIQF